MKTLRVGDLLGWFVLGSDCNLLAVITRMGGTGTTIAFADDNTECTYRPGQLDELVDIGYWKLIR